MFRVLSLSVPAAILLASLPTANAHAAVKDIRVPGPAHLAACGKTSFDEVTKDPTGHIEDQEPVNAGCELQLCRGLLFEDQAAAAASTVSITPGGNITFNVDCTIPHGGPANVALVDTTTGGTGTVIGGFLKEFDDFCPTTGTAPADQTTLQVTLPDAATIAGRCAKPGDCVTQLFWATPDLSQNYYYCKDTIVSGGESPAAPPPAASDVAATTTAAAEEPVDTSVAEEPIDLPGEPLDSEVPVEEDPVVEDPTDADSEVIEDPTDVDPVDDTTVDPETPVDDTTDPEAPVADPATETATATATGTATAAPTASAAPGTGNNTGASSPTFQKFIDFIKNLFGPKAAQDVEAKALAGGKRWAKEQY